MNESHYASGVSWKTGQENGKEPSCLGHLKSTCTGNCGFYRQCLEKTQNITIINAERDFDAPK